MNLSNLSKKIKSLNSNLDGISDDLVSTLKDYQREYESLLRSKAFDLSDGKLKSTIKHYNAAQSINPMSKLGFNTIALDQVKTYPQIVKDQLAFNASIGISTDITFKDVEILERLQKLDFSIFQTEAKLLDERIKRELVNAIALEMPYQQTVDNLSKSMLGAGGKTGSLAGFSNTYMRTALFSLSKAVDQEIYDDLGIDKYIYAGPIDAKTRPFCAARIGKTFTTEQINKFGSLNGSGLNGFLMPGGWNCRHRMIPEEVIEED